MEALRIQRWVLVLGFVIMGIKLLAWWLTGALSVLSDALESVINLTAGAFSMYAIWLSARPHDHDHPYGHGKIQFLAAGLEGGLIVFAASAIVWKAIQGFQHPQPITDLASGAILTAIAGTTHFLLGRYMMKKGKQNRSLALEAGGRHLWTDAFSSFALLLAFLAFRFFPYPWLDPAISIGFALYIGFSGFSVLRASLAGIMDEADPEVLDKVAQVLRQQKHPKLIDIHNLRVIRYGGDIHIDAHATIPWFLNVKEGHDVLEEVSQQLQQAFPNRVEVFLHADPCLTSSCRICPIEHCDKRATAFEEEILWDVPVLQANRRHA